MTRTPNALRIGTRSSALALAQTRLIAEELAEGGHARPEIMTLTTSGDRAGASGGDKSRWVDTIEEALLADEIDLAVHSAKDLPGELAGGLTLLGAPARAAVEDVLCFAPAPSARGGEDGDGDVHGADGGDDEYDGAPKGADGLAVGARVGTSSIRRAAQLRAARADLDVVAMRGNVDTRLRKLAEGELDAIVLARAGLQRLDREDAIDAVLNPAQFVPAPGQGALALEARAGDDRVHEAVAAILDAHASVCLQAERALASALGASCHTPLGAHAAPAGCGCLTLRAWVGLPDGSAWVADELLGGFYEPAELGARVAERMTATGARELLARAEEMAAGVGA
ncbi:MAG TPA: hydroxymethylbilane synthase [Solirubrobacteraceae bacterium]|nr:hydroxymethylbilane synthase [Solirubrobacteraceae bacterium]